MNCFLKNMSIVMIGISLFNNNAYASSFDIAPTTYKNLYEGDIENKDKDNRSFFLKHKCLTIFSTILILALIGGSIYYYRSGTQEKTEEQETVETEILDIDKILNKVIESFISKLKYLTEEQKECLSYFENSDPEAENSLETFKKNSEGINFDLINSNFIALEVKNEDGMKLVNNLLKESFDEAFDYKKLIKIVLVGPEKSGKTFFASCNDASSNLEYQPTLGGGI